MTLAAPAALFGTQRASCVHWRWPLGAASTLQTPFSGGWWRQRDERKGRARWLAAVVVADKED